VKVLVLLTDAFGGHGGIALYNRDFLTAMCSHPECEKVVAIPRLMPHSCEPIPVKLTYVTGGINSKARYIATVMQTVMNYSGFDLIICGHINLLPIAYVISRWVSAPLLLEIYGIDAWKYMDRKITNYLTGKVDAFVSISQVTKEHFFEWANVRNSKCFILPNAIHVERYGPGQKNPELIERYGFQGKTILMTLGRLESSERYKGFDEIMELLPILKEDIPNIVYLIVGDGSDRPRLEAKAMSLGVEERVVFAGFIPEAEKAEHYRLADVYVMPSSGEGFGFVFLEAMACGVPVVAGKMDGSREALRNGELGTLVDPADPEDIKSGILNAIKAPRGIVPEGLGYFSYSCFERRLHQIIDQIMTVE
jgi:glycosyltransferase involved in cell wall biosynthesis